MSRGIYSEVVKKGGNFLMEKELINKVKNGDRQAFKQLYDLHFDYAMRVATAVTKNQNTASDVVQETFIRVYKNIGDFDCDKAFKPWFYRILINECNRYLKKQAKVIPMEIDDKVKLEPQIDAHHFEEYEDLYDAIQSLDDTQRIPIVLKYLNDFTEMDIALALELNINTVKSRLFKGKRKLKELLLKIREA